MAKTLTVHGIGQLVVVPRGPVAGPAMRDVRLIDEAALVARDGRIAWFGREADLPSFDGDRLDARGGAVIPGLIDCHTHAVFAGTREHEFELRIAGASYEQIAREGGGIRTTVDAVRRATRDDLVALALPRVRRMLERGVTTVEIKSGYGLTVEDEKKMLLAAGDVGEALPIEVVRTWLAAHTTPREFSGDPDGYLDTILDPGVLDELHVQGLAEFCDVFCETTAFDVARSERVLTTAAAHGLAPKVHADQITQMGATLMAARVGAVSADHLETVHDEAIDAMREAGTIGVLLPACSMYLGVAQAPARKLIDAGLPVAVATDYNPGSSVVESLPLTMGIACTQMRMTPTEVLVAVTANAAAALRRQDRLGAIDVGMQADLAILDVPDFRRMCYELGRDCVRWVIKAGEVVVDRRS